MRIELRNMWSMDSDIMPAVMDDPGAVTKEFKDYLAKLPGLPEQFMLQKNILLTNYQTLVG